MSRAEDEYGVEGDNPTTTCREVEKVRIPVLCQTAIGGLGKLLLEEGKVFFEPV
jgi:hypothetical protein